MKAMVFAAGLGTRLKPLTDDRPKALVEVDGRPMLDRLLEKLQAAGFDDIVVNVHHFPDLMCSHLASRWPSVAVSDERDALLETGGALRKAAPLLRGGSGSGSGPGSGSAVYLAPGPRSASGAGIAPPPGSASGAGSPASGSGFGVGSGTECPRSARGAGIAPSPGSASGAGSPASGSGFGVGSGTECPRSARGAGIAPPPGGSGPAEPCACARDIQPGGAFLAHNVDILSDVDLRRFWDEALRLGICDLIGPAGSAQPSACSVALDPTKGGTSRLDGPTNSGPASAGPNTNWSAETGHACVRVPETPSPLQPSAGPTNSGPEVPSAEPPVAVLLVTDRPSSRSLLFDDRMRLVGWRNNVTGALRSPYPHLDPSECRAYAFSGIHVISDRLLDLLESWPERFSITDFYIANCAVHPILGHLAPSVRVLDLGKPEALAQAASLLADPSLDPYSISQLSGTLSLTK